MNIDESATDDSALVDPLLYFDATNWLLDENFVDIESWDLNWYESRRLTVRPHLKSTSLSFAKESNNPPKVLDLRRMWYIKIQTLVDHLHDDGAGTGRQAVNALRRDIDETYHTKMVEELRTPLRNEPLPSIDFLVFDMFPHISYI